MHRRHSTKSYPSRNTMLCRQMSTNLDTSCTIPRSNPTLRAKRNRQMRIDRLCNEQFLQRLSATTGTSDSLQRLQHHQTRLCNERLSATTVSVAIVRPSGWSTGPVSRAGPLGPVSLAIRFVHWVQSLERTGCSLECNGSWPQSLECTVEALEARGHF